ncbi:MAG: NACHT domain-containing NTPase [Cyanobacteria bacterium J06607_15]
MARPSNHNFSMAKPSLKASEAGVQTAKQTLKITGMTQKELARQVECSSQPVTNFFQGKAIDQNLFIKFCDRLDLEWQEIAGLKTTAPQLIESKTKVKPELNQVQAMPQDISSLVAKLRSLVSPWIEEQCGTMRILDMSHPVEINDIYTNVNILEKITGRIHKNIEQLMEECDSEEFERFSLGKITQAPISGSEAISKYQKLIILGKPGAGKTTFLRHLAIQCDRGHFDGSRVPIFVNLKRFAESVNQPNLLEYISQQLANFTFPRASRSTVEQYVQDFAAVLHEGRGLILLDGLDEVRAEDSDRLIREIREFSLQFRHNHFAITCRIAAWKYNFVKYTEVEIADFELEQIEAFAEKWFQHKQISHATFLQRLGQNPRLQQLAVSPMLLTLVCLAFEESGCCPDSRSELYKEGVDALLKKWDASRGIQRDRIYQQMSHQRKEDLLSRLAIDTFEQKNYFFKQFYVEQFIADYIRNLPRNNNEPEELLLDSEAILKSIEAQHGLLVERAKGIYSFSHLTFQEYFTAREIVFNSRSLDDSLKKLLHNVADRRWREIFLLTSEMLRDASLLLLPIKAYAEQLVANSEQLQKFLDDVAQRSEKLKFSGIKPAAIRAFYYDVDFEIDENRSVALQLDRQANYLVCASFLTRKLEGISLAEGIRISQQYDANVAEPEAKIIAAKSANAVMAIAIKIALSSEKLTERERQKLLLLSTKERSENDERVTQEIADQARDDAKANHRLGHKITLDFVGQKLWREYYYVVKLLVDCLNCDGCMLSPELRPEITAHLFSFHLR